jgi:hypothetical protein
MVENYRAAGFCDRAGGKTREFLVIEKGLIQTARRVDVPHFINEKHEPVFFPLGNADSVFGFASQVAKVASDISSIGSACPYSSDKHSGPGNWIDFE